jgi:hypothetical protein
MNTQLKQMRLVFTIDGDWWNARVELVESDEVLWQGMNEVVDPSIQDQIMDDREIQMRSLPVWNIVEHRRDQA